MLLAVDAGNTQTVLGLFDGVDLAAHWRLSTDASLTADELRLKAYGLLALEGKRPDDVDAIVLASVVPSLTVAWQEVARATTGQEAMVVGPGLRTSMPIRYDNPHEVGADRVVNSIAAQERFGAPVLVVDFGTATTVDVVSADGAYIGGAIAPGVETSADALFSKAARLSKVDLERPAKVIGTNTRASVQAGLLLGQAAMVDGLVRTVWAELGTATPVVATGGLATLMAPLCETVTAVDEDLTLVGLRIVWERNR